MNNKKRKHKLSILRKVLILIMIIGCLFIFITLKDNKGGLFSKGKETTKISHSLSDVFKINELSTAQFIYNGIAKTEKDKKDIYIMYYATVRVGIDKEITFKVNDKEKKVYVKLPELIYDVSLADSDKAMKFSNDERIDLAKARKICKKDVEKEAKKSENLRKEASDNLECTVRALAQPILSKNEYKIKFE